ncbi:type I-E CRISPR-associated protein Cse1/CasA [Kallotenue papyrolyticum]|uniref:type I-E CRISPR-associated protein Cse1/CasA n=1 Tax=Kallotenue papyrolyticum TaxID=1325125 RepID=UPI00046F652B|nr:type I-E CRISPR-associated protein Cse1/CasA [Kallotenue papyrolyticum]
MTQPTYNLVDRPWIPCVLRGDGSLRLLSLRETLGRASEISEIVDPSPLVTVALHRLLLAILHRCYGPATVDDWQALWEAGQSDARIDAYLDQWRHRFDLFDPVYPFYQTADISEEYAKPISNIAPEFASGNNATLWDHSTNTHFRALSCDQAARYLVALQASALGGLLSYRKDEKEHKSADAAPLANSAVALVRGDNLWRTLLLNLHQYDGEEEPFPNQRDDRPAWERDTPTRAGDREVSGYLDLLTWQSRQARLFWEGDPERVTRVAILKGWQFPRVGYRFGKETMLAFRANPNARGEQDPWPPLGFQEDRLVWRDSLVLFQSIHERHARPKILDWLARLVYDGILPPAAALSLELYGLASNQAKPLFWRHERLPLPTQYLHDESLLTQLQIALDWAEQGKNVLNHALQLLAERQLVPYPPPEGISRDDRERARQIAATWGAERDYWARLDLPFRRLLEGLPKDTGVIQPYGETLMPQWAATIHRAARASFDEVTRSLDTSGRWMRALAITEPMFLARLRKIGATSESSSVPA